MKNRYIIVFSHVQRKGTEPEYLSMRVKHKRLWLLKEEDLELRQKTQKKKLHKNKEFFKKEERVKIHL